MLYYLGLSIMRLSIISLSLLLFLLNYTLTPQSIRFERTDVEGRNARFVTATYSFGIDIRIDDIEHCSNVAFELTHNQIRLHVGNRPQTHPPRVIVQRIPQLRLSRPP